MTTAAGLTPLISAGLTRPPKQIETTRGAGGLLLAGQVVLEVHIVHYIPV
jgi:hypothetical protein